MEALAPARVMTRKPQINFATPAEVRDRWDEFVAPYGARRGSTVGVAAMLAFMHADAATRDAWIERVASAEAVNRVAKLLPPRQPKLDTNGRRDSANARRVPVIDQNGDYHVDDGKPISRRKHG